MLYLSCPSPAGDICIKSIFAFDAIRLSRSFVDFFLLHSLVSKIPHLTLESLYLLDIADTFSDK